MQWNLSDYAGFSLERPELSVNSNNNRINAGMELIIRTLSSIVIKS